MLHDLNRYGQVGKFIHLDVRTWSCRWDAGVLLCIILIFSYNYCFAYQLTNLLHAHVFSQKHLLWKVEVEVFSSHITQLRKIIKRTLFLTIKVTLMIYLLHLSIRSPERKGTLIIVAQLIPHKNFAHHFFHLYELCAQTHYIIL